MVCLASGQQQPQCGADQRQDPGDQEQLVERADEGIASRRNRLGPALLGRPGATGCDPLRRSARRRAGKPGLDPVLEDCPEPRDPHRDSHLAAGVVDAGTHPGLRGGDDPTATEPG